MEIEEKVMQENGTSPIRGLPNLISPLLAVSAANRSPLLVDITLPWGMWLEWKG